MRLLTYQVIKSALQQWWVAQSPRHYDQNANSSSSNLNILLNIYYFLLKISIFVAYELLFKIGQKNCCLGTFENQK